MGYYSAQDGTTVTSKKYLVDAEPKSGFSLLRHSCNFNFAWLGCIHRLVSSHAKATCTRTAMIPPSDVPILAEVIITVIAGFEGGQSPLHFDNSRSTVRRHRLVDFTPSKGLPMRSERQSSTLLNDVTSIINAGVIVPNMHQRAHARLSTAMRSALADCAASICLIDVRSSSLAASNGISPSIDPTCKRLAGTSHC